MNIIKRFGIISLSSILVFSMSGCAKKQDSKQEQKQFDEFIHQEFIETMEQSYLNTHILFEHPENYDIDVTKTPIEIGEVIDEDSFDETRKINEKSEKQFNQFDRDLLTSSQQEIYDTFKFQLDNAIQMSDPKFDYIGTPFESMSGIHVNLTSIFTDWIFRNEQDIKDMMTVMKSVRPYIQSLLDYTKKQEEHETLMIDIDQVKEYCEKVIQENTNSSILSELYESVDSLNLSTEKTIQYKKEIETIFVNDFLPTYQDIIDTLNSLDPDKNHKFGLSHLENGKEYYELLFRQATGTDKSIQDIQKELHGMKDSMLLTSQILIQRNPSLLEDFMNQTILTNYHDFDTMLNDLSTDIQNDFPSINTLNYQIEPIAKDLASSGIAAYFKVPAIDGTTPKQIRVNMLDNALNIQAPDTFATVAHEGIPGHMYQFAYMYENVDNLWMKTVSNCLGYTEGYANYVELYSLKYIDGISKDALKLQESMFVYQNCLIALADIGIHYEGWDLDETKSFFENNGLAINDITALYYQLQANPTTFLPYYVGYVQIANMKSRAQKTLQDQFNDKEFHEAILKSGVVPFSVVEENINEYIESKK